MSCRQAASDRQPQTEDHCIDRNVQELGNPRAKPPETQHHSTPSWSRWPSGKPSLDHFDSMHITAARRRVGKATDRAAWSSPSAAPDCQYVTSARLASHPACDAAAKSTSALARSTPLRVSIVKPVHSRAHVGRSQHDIYRISSLWVNRRPYRPKGKCRHDVKDCPPYVPATSWRATIPFEIMLRGLDTHLPYMS